MSENTPAPPAAVDGEDGFPYSSGRPVHFEIQAADIPRAVRFYVSVFGWTAEDWSEYAGAPYFGVTTGDGPGIDGAILGRPGGENPEVGGPVAGVVLTIGVADYDEMTQRIIAAGGSVALPKYALPGMAWQGYFHDTENNVFGLHQPDPEAR
ncbi:VOC family protein [Brachybacterium sp. p3-SID957]|uniref:VOC family protein n=1 Tax=Brachybacterium sp. p3-SID957 TaxID=2916049 RepID=UPI00223AF7EA|nr:VOC family protein [Brachybacterium sp. p3-SID957]MCT1776494.1 VOC family protein [Brachybacterium sp. p3-SID957]